ncbi:MAG TPA: hypothetical protein VL181_11190 [Holophagaceae bacterium]|nr:hypothetical protein [Holophagaceae bacterium]
MNDDRDAELTQELEALVAAKEREQLKMKLMFGLALLDAVLAGALHQHLGIALAMGALAVFGIVLGVRAHLRAAALRGQAMEKILAEAFRRAGQAPPTSEP